MHLPSRRAARSYLNAGTVSLDVVCLNELTDAERAGVRLRQIGFVFQTFQLFDTLTASENVALSLTMGGLRRRDALRRAEEGLARMGCHTGVTAFHAR